MAVKNDDAECRESQMDAVDGDENQVEKIIENNVGPKWSMWIKFQE